ncbi:sensor histidine kinase [Labedaea rhizosphaerae]|uniref:sensor histidine kinase n=1 Tax=Labedaea rhizosphaerae TaxID=598644 RepID=UPI00105DA0CC|nr:sensor histidine kinase [Labedaea rhizosphaerae]
MVQDALTVRSQRRLAARSELLEWAAVAALALVLLRHDLAEGPPAYRWVFTVCLLAPLLWRRRAPLTVFAVVAAVAAVQWWLDVVALADIALPVALYGVASRDGRAWPVAGGAVVMEVGAVLAAQRWSPAGSEWTIFVLLSGTTVAALATGLAVRTRAQYVAALVDRAARAERERDQLARIAVVTERGRIAREMHDIVAHTLSVMIALANGAAYTMDSEPAKARSAVEQAARLGSTAQAEMRRLLGVLRVEPADGSAPQPDTASLDDLLAAVRLAGLPTRFVVVGKAPQLAASAQLTIYRLVQEALTNVVRHAGPGATATVTLSWQDRRLNLEVVDDGHGGTGNPGHGLTGMRERAALFGGELDAGSGPDGGWRVHAVLDFAEPAP